MDSKVNHFKKIVPVIILVVGSFANAQQSTFTGPKVNLDDIKIKGDANGDNSAFSNRAQHSLGQRIKLRVSFRKEILEELPTYFISSDSSPVPQR